VPELIDIERGKTGNTMDVEALGGKAYQQALAAADGLPVPVGSVLTTDAFPGKAWLDQQSSRSPAQQAQAVREYLKGLGIDLIAALRRLPSNRLAFRSSANVEDMTSASFAGSFTTKLNVRPETCFSAIYEVWASAFTERVRQYVSDRGLVNDWEAIKMAVLIQPMVSPLVSGVALSHPAGRPEEPNILVSVVRGLGEPLVGGEVDPQTYTLERGTWAIVKQQDAIDVEILYEAAAEIGRVVEFLELRRGHAQDIEFAIQPRCEFILLQNRAIALGRRDLTESPVLRATNIR
jgi:phosphoenolpyruvate synthase/pyruvate phosphate dikinase